VLRKRALVVCRDSDEAARTTDKGACPRTSNANILTIWIFPFEVRMEMMSCRQDSNGWSVSIKDIW